jgi:hypothetical protein
MVAVALGAAGASSCSSPAKRKLTLQEMIAADPLPLAKGAKWTYAVTMTRFDVEANKELTSELTWTTEVLDVREANGVRAFRIKGWPTDLADHDGTATPTATERTILRKDNSFLFGGPSEFAAEPSLDGAEGWFSWPVTDGQKICPSAEMVYCWQVSAIDTGYRFTFYTGPDEQSFDLEPATGISRFHYAHHGTTNEVEARLTDYRPGPAR